MNNFHVSSKAGSCTGRAVAVAKHREATTSHIMISNLQVQDKETLHTQAINMIEQSQQERALYKMH